MTKFKKSQILILSLLAVLLSITPLLSSSVRTTYLYFVINILIIALGAEAGLLSCFPKPAEDKKHPASAAPKPEASADEKPVAPATAEKKAKVIEKSASEKVVGAVKMDEVKKCPSTPSLFFIGGGETDQAENVGDQEYDDDDDDDDDQEEEEASDEQELFTKAETFIGNFYKQLKMQREESWNRIHGLYQKAF
ncbi:hypothetical protein FH972_020302 [Carpinus fangiana]|uniref:DUF4408 domain-containing protein n=1 Tax=Carpinus fangiana TaxID=176857 RepID=A0A5N6RTA7_9ROSI|nr:hypothetical protein FH972_020302 [Carpinus fangiana]